MEYYCSQGISYDLDKIVIFLALTIGQDTDMI